jgi:hypothetical protein
VCVCVCVCACGVRLAHEAVHFPQPGAKVKEWSYIATPPYGSIACARTFMYLNIRIINTSLCLW